MQIFKNRPLALSLSLFAVTAVLSVRMEGTVKLCLLCAAVLLLAVIVTVSALRRRMGRRRLLGALCLLCVFGALLSSFLFFQIRYRGLQENNGNICRAEGYVVERLSSAAYYGHLRVHITEFNGEQESFDAILECTYLSSLQVGDRFAISAIPRAYTEHEQFDEESFRLSEGCLMILTSSSTEDYRILEGADTGVRTQASKLNTRLSYGLRNRIGGEAGGVASALLLGNRTWLSDDTALHFRRAGVSHLLALSGLHVSILIGFLELLLKKLRMPNSMRAILIPLSAIGYLALTGFAMSTCRAVLMVTVLYLGFLLRSRYDAFTALLAVLVLILVTTPYAVLDISMWMSFLAAASIIIFSPAFARLIDGLPIKRKLPKPLFLALKGFLMAIAVGTVANLALLLLSAAVFGEMSLASVPATLLLSIPVEAMMILSAILLCLPFLPILPWACNAMGKLILVVTSAFSDIKGVLLPTADTPTLILLSLVTLSLILLAVLRIRRKRWALVPIALCLAAVISSLCVTHLPVQSEPTAITVPAGRGEARLYVQNGRGVLVNDMRGNSTESFEIKHTALAARCTELGDLVLCRYYNQANYFIARIAAQMRVDTIHMPTPMNEREIAIAARLCQEAELHGIRVLYDAEVWLLEYEG